jgi:hypothetical protein
MKFGSAQETIQKFADPSEETIALSFLTPTIEDVHPSAAWSQPTLMAFPLTQKRVCRHPLHP